jgi:peroxiredoxin
LADFETHGGALQAGGARVVAGSVDRAPVASSTVEDLGLGFTVLYDLDATSVAAAIGCYAGTHQGRPHLQPAAFILRADGTVAYTVYSSGRAGRLTAADVLGLLDDL